MAHGDWEVGVVYSKESSSKLKNFKLGQIFNKGWEHNVNSRQMGNHIENVAFLHSRKRMACMLLFNFLFTIAIVAFG